MIDQQRQLLQSRPLDHHAASPGPRRRGRGWGLLIGATVLALVWGLLWGVFVHIRTDAYPGGTIPVGEAWVDDQGTRFYVLATETHTELPQGRYSDPKRAPAGASYLLVHMRYENRSKESYCAFDLIGAHREVWSSVNDLPRGDDVEDKYLWCKPADEAPAKAEFWMSYLVPTDRIEGARLGRQFMALRQPPAMALPPSR